MMVRSVPATAYRYSVYTVFASGESLWQLSAAPQQGAGSQCNVITLNGPEPLESLHSPPDSQHYLDKQLAPAADGILHFLDTDFASITDAQIALF